MRRPLSFYFLFAFFCLFLLFLYGPILAIFMLSLQGADGQLMFPLRSFGFYWLGQVFQEQRVGNFVEPFLRSLALGIIVTLIAIGVSLPAALAFRQRFRGSGVILYLTIASLIVPSLLISLGIGIVFQVLGWQTHWLASGLGAHLTWIVPFAFLIFLGVFNRFNPSYEEAARDLGASELKVFSEIVLPLIAPSLVGIAILGFTLSYDEFTRTSLISGQNNTLPLEVFGMTTNVTTPALYALGTLTTVFSLAMITVAITTVNISRARQRQ
jgi:putative spermidine/putrescine transport system permease protein